MKVQYQKGKNKRFMILDGDKYPENYETEMMKENNIGALLPFYSVEKDGKIQYWYDITGQRSLEEYLLQEGINIEILYKIFLYLKLAVEEIQDYLISEEHILMQPDTVFIKKENDSGIGLCFFPQNNNEIALLPIGEYLINNADHRNKEVTFICYKLYEMIQEPGFLYSELISEIKDQIDKTEKIEDKIMRNTFSAEMIEMSTDTLEKNKKVIIPEYDNDINNEKESAGIYKDRYDDKNDQKKNEKRDIFMKTIKVIKQKINEKIEMILDRLYELFPQLRDITGKNLDNKKDEAIGRLIYEGNSGENDYCIDQKVFKIGKDKKRSDALLHSLKINRTHSVIERKNGRFYLKDLNSKSGTYHNGRRLEHGEYVKPEEMDTISFADVPYRFA